jgi:hypothetical protein
MMCFYLFSLTLFEVTPHILHVHGVSSTSVIGRVASLMKTSASYFSSLTYTHTFYGSTNRERTEYLNVETLFSIIKAILHLFTSLPDFLFYIVQWSSNSRIEIMMSLEHKILLSMEKVKRIVLWHWMGFIHSSYVKYCAVDFVFFSLSKIPHVLFRWLHSSIEIDELRSFHKINTYTYFAE